MPQVQLARKDRSIVRTRGLFVAACFLFISLGVVAAWFISADSTTNFLGIEAFVRFMLSPWMLATHVVALSFIAFGLWFLDTPFLHPEAVSDFDAALRRCGRLLLLVLFLFSAALTTVGYLFIADLRSTFRAQRLAQDEGIAHLKAEQIDKWIFDRALDARTLAQALRGLPVESVAKDREMRQIVRVLFGESLAGNADRIGIALVTPDGTVAAAVGEIAADSIPLDMDALLKDDKGLKIVDAHLRSGSMLAMEFVVPVFSGDKEQKAIGAVVLAADPGRDLFKQIVKWPVDSPGSEIIVVRRDGGSLQLLSPAPLLGREPPALSFRLPLTQGDLPGVQAFRKGDGSREGRDYRGKRVFSASAHVTGVPWYVVAKTDVDEAMASWRQKTMIAAGAIAATILSAAFIVFILWRGQRNTYRAYRLSRDRERSVMTAHFEALVRLARDPVLLIDPAGRIADCNEAAVAAYGYGADEFRSLAIAALEAPGTDRQSVEVGLVETVHRRKDGTTFPVEISSRAIDVDGRLFHQSFVRDISLRRRLEGDLQRLARVQRALRAAHGILLRATSQTRLLEGMCEVIVHMGGYRLAFIGFPNHDPEKTVGFAAIAGLDAARIKAAGIRWDDSPAGRGPTGMALKTGAIQVRQDFASDPAGVPWQNDQLSMPFGSGISLPLRVSGAMIGTLTIYAAETNAFDDEEVELLTEFVDDLSYGIGALRTRRGLDLAQSVQVARG
jgi:PAS domain S-box-containing protein